VSRSRRDSILATDRRIRLGIWGLGRGAGIGVSLLAMP
jgi:hypothetical protein